MKANKIPEYVIRSLKAHGNTIIALPTMEALGGVEGILSLLKAKGFDCRVRESEHIEIKGEHSCKIYDHAVVEEVPNER